MVVKAGFTFLSRLVSALLYFGLIVAISRLLGPAERGICALYLLIIAIVAAISDIAGGAASSFLLNRYHPARLQKNQMVWAILPAILVPAIFYFTTGLQWYEAGLLVLASWVHSCWTMQQHIQLGLKRFTRFNLMTVFVPLLAVAGFSLLWILGFQSRHSYLLALFISWGMAFIAGAIQLARDTRLPGENDGNQSLQDVYRFGLMNQLAHLASILNARLVFFILQATMLGLFSNALTLGEAMLLVPGSIGQVVYALLSGEKDSSRKQEIFEKAWWGNLVLMVLGCLGVLMLPEAFWTALFGDAFTGIKKYLLTLLPGIALYSIYLIISYWQSSRGKFEHNLWALLAGLAINMLLTAIFLLLGNYSVEKGIFALVLGWVTATIFSVTIFALNSPRQWYNLMNPMHMIKLVKHGK